MKRNKLGTTIILALAPACALGVTAGVVVSTIQANKESVVSMEEWFAQYDPISESYQSSKTSFANDEIEVTYNGEKKEVVYIDTFTYKDNRHSGVGFEKGYCYFSGTKSSQLKEEATASDSVTYIISSNYLSIVMKKGDKASKYVINRNGYILNYSCTGSTNPWENYQLSMNYKAQPHHITKFVGYWNNTMSGYMSQFTYLIPETEYTVEYNLIHGLDIDMFFAENLGVRVPSNIISITLDDTELSSPTDWEWDDVNSRVNFKQIINSGKLVVKFTINSLTSYDYASTGLGQQI